MNLIRFKLYCWRWVSVGRQENRGINLINGRHRLLDRDGLAFFEDTERGEVELSEFPHDLILVGWLEMIRVERDILATELAEFCCKQCGCEVFADLGQILLGIRIGTFDERRLEVRDTLGC